MPGLKQYTCSSIHISRFQIHLTELPRTLDTPTRDKLIVDSLAPCVVDRKVLWRWMSAAAMLPVEICRSCKKNEGRCEACIEISNAGGLSTIGTHERCRQYAAELYTSDVYGNKVVGVALHM
jgi:hypothetical protein